MNNFLSFAQNIITNFLFSLQFLISFIFPCISHPNYFQYFHLFNQAHNYYSLPYLTSSGMIIRFAKVEIKDNTKDGHFLDISIHSNQMCYQLKSMRKIRNKVSNFYGESICLPVPAKSVNIGIEHVSREEGRKKIFDMALKFQEQNINKKGYGHIVSENQIIKLYCSWQLQSSSSHYSSEFSIDIINIETPKKYFQDQQKTPFQQFSPRNNFQINRIKIYLQEVKSQRIRSSIANNRQKQVPFKKQQKLQTIENPKIILRSKTVVTLSNTSTKVQQLKRSLPINNIDQKGNEYKKKKTFNKTASLVKGKEKNLVQNFRRKNSLNINKVGATIASTLGLFAGIIAGIAASPY